ncbi:hypothetical protein L9F63_007179, partial [Diploptera punctata]
SERNVEMEDDEDEMEINDASEDDEELNVDDEDQEENDLTSSPVDLTSRRHSSAQLMLANHSYVQYEFFVIVTKRPESVSSVGSGLSVGGSEGLRSGGGGGPSTTTTGSGRRNLAFSVENILDPTKFTATGRLVTAPTDDSSELKIRLRLYNL